MLASRGLDTGPWVRRVVETLYVDYPHGPDVSYADVRNIVSNWCPASVPPTPRTSHP